MCERPMPEIPFEIISTDHLSLTSTIADNQYVLVYICHATRYVLARPTQSTSTDEVIHFLEHDIIFKYGPPLIYISDNATSFTSQKAKQTYLKYGISHSTTTPYTPQSNRLVERSNATIISVLTKFVLENKNDWDTKLPNAILAINITKQSSANFTPFFLLHGFQPRIPPDELMELLLVNCPHYNKFQI